jgi:hypothetical protein
MLQNELQSYVKKHATNIHPQILSPAAHDKKRLAVKRWFQHSTTPVTEVMYAAHPNQGKISKLKDVHPDVHHELIAINHCVKDDSSSSAQSTNQHRR